MSLPSIVLNNTNNGASKTYHVSIQEHDSGYSVNFAYGKIGSALKGGTKTQSPVDFNKAKAVFDKLVKSKVSKGYTPEGDQEATSFSLQDETSESSGFFPQLLNPIDEAEALELIENEEFVAQRKMDGQRRTVQIFLGLAKGINKKGNFVPLPDNLTSQLGIMNHALIDCEIVANSLYAFDLLNFNEKDFSALPYSSRFEKLKVLIDSYNLPDLKLVEHATSVTEKQALYEKLKVEGREGIVFKRKTSPYKPNRPASGGDQLKYKFVESVSAVVSKINDKRSVALQVFDQGKAVDIGNVTIPVNHAIPSLGAVVEVQYLYANPSSQKLFQPVYKSPRQSVEQSECLISQLKYQRDEQS